MKKRLWDDSEGDDPAAGLINLFDVWIAFAAALLLAVVSYFNLPKPTPGAPTDAQADTVPALQQCAALGAGVLDSGVDGAWGWACHGVSLARWAGACTGVRTDADIGASLAGGAMPC